MPFCSPLIGQCDIEADVAADLSSLCICILCEFRILFEFRCSCLISHPLPKSAVGEDICRKP